MPEKQSVFLSYKHNDSDKDFIDMLIRKIKDAGFATWIDSDNLRAGEDWRKGIDEGIKTALILVVIMTPEARASEFVTYEWSFALGNKVPVIPIMLRKTELHPKLEVLQYIDFTVSRQWAKLTKRLRAEQKAGQSESVKELVTEEPVAEIQNPTSQAIFEALEVLYSTTTSEVGVREVLRALTKHKILLPAHQAKIATLARRKSGKSTIDGG